MTSTCSLYIISLNGGSHYQNQHLYNIHASIKRNVEARIMFGQRLWYTNSWLPQRGVETLPYLSCKHDREEEYKEERAPLNWRWWEKWAPTLLIFTSKLFKVVCNGNVWSCSKIDVPNSTTDLNQTPKFEWYGLRCSSKNNYRKTYVKNRLDHVLKIW